MSAALQATVNSARSQRTERNRVPVRQVGAKFSSSAGNPAVLTSAPGTARTITPSPNGSMTKPYSLSSSAFSSSARLLVGQRDGDARQQPLGVRFLVGSQLSYRIRSCSVVDDIDRV
ncbi:MAG: hypothetical protein ACLUFV_05955 [Acutalibacteraceae bacterium]